MIIPFLRFLSTISAITASVIPHVLELRTSLVSAGVMPGPRSAMMSIVVGNKIYLMGGLNATAAQNQIWTASVDSPHIVGDSLSTIPSIIRNGKCLTVGNTIYIFGGANTAQTAQKTI